MEKYDEVIDIDRLKIVELNSKGNSNSFASDVKSGLIADKKFFLPKYFYDENGSKLFEMISETDEYYPTRTEISILKNLSDEISERNFNKNFIVEFGSGSSVKTDYILNSFLKTRDKLHYIPIDVSNIIIESSRILTGKYKNLYITGLISLFEEGMNYVKNTYDSPKLILFLGSSIGNFSTAEAVAFLKMIKNGMNQDDRLLIGFDLIKEKDVIFDAYNDKLGVTKKFNLNILQRINNELEGNFDLNLFEHSAIYNDNETRIEMYLTAKQNMTIEIKKLDLKVNFYKGEKIHTENSKKFNYDMIKQLADSSGLEFSDYYTDEKNYFSLCAFRSV